MFDFSKLTDVSKLASQAKQIQQQQEHIQQQQIDLLHTISGQLQEVIVLLQQQKEISEKVLNLEKSLDYKD